MFTRHYNNTEAVPLVWGSFATSDQQASMAPPMAFAVVGAFVFMALANFLAMKKFFGGKDNKEISDSNPTFVTPDGATFGIWGFIYMLEALLVFAQVYWANDPENQHLMGQLCPLTGMDVRARLILAFVANGIWLPTFNNEWFVAGLGIMAAYYGFLLSVYYSLSSASHGLTQAVIYVSGISMNTSWITVATVLSAFFCAGRAGWRDRNGVAGSPLAAKAVVVGVALVAIACLARCLDMAWAFTAAWALRGIFRMQTIDDKVRFPIGSLDDSLGRLARTASYSVIGAMLVGALYYFRRGEPGRF